MHRRICSGLLLIAIAASGGCDSDGSRAAVYQLRTNDYELEFDGLQKRTTDRVGAFRMVRIPEDIEVIEGRLKVGPRDYGAVQLKDKISVVGRKVAVNGQERTPSES
jgi:hypothetical protein